MIGGTPCTQLRVSWALPRGGKGGKGGGGGGGFGFGAPQGSFPRGGGGGCYGGKYGGIEASLASASGVSFFSAGLAGGPGRLVGTKNQRLIRNMKAFSFSERSVGPTGRRST